MEKWYVVYTQPHAENKAVVHLNRQGFTTYLPKFIKMRRHARRIEPVATPVFPRYLFVSLNPKESPWRVIQSTIGVVCLICCGDQPAPVPGGIVDEIRQHENTKGFVTMGKQLPLKRGDKVRVTAGPMLDHIGLFDCASGEERVIVLLNLLGRDVKVKLPLEAVGTYA